MAGRFCKSCVPRDQWSIECFSECDISGIVCGEIAPQRPDPSEKNIVRVTIHWQIGEIFERLLGSLDTHFAGESIATQDLSNFKVEYMRRVQCIGPVKQPLAHFRRCRRVQ